MMLESRQRISVSQPIQVGRKFPELPSFAAHAEGRRRPEARPVAACRASAVQGQEPGVAGHPTARDLERLPICGGEYVGSLPAPTVRDSLAKAKPRADVVD